MNLTNGHQAKCHNMHIGRNKENCKELKVQNTIVHESLPDKYLGDIINKTANQRETVKDRKAKGYGIVGQFFGNHNISTIRIMES